MNYRPVRPWWENPTSIVTVAGIDPDDADLELDAALPDYDERRKDRRLFG